MILGYLGGVNVITRVPKSEDEGRGEVRGKGMQKGIELSLLDLRLESGPHAEKAGII